MQQEVDFVMLEGVGAVKHVKDHQPQTDPKVKSCVSWTCLHADHLLQQCGRGYGEEADG